MKRYIIKMHSIVDLITNSSTVIFTYQDGSLQAIKEMINEMIKTFDLSLTFDDLFYAAVIPDEYRYDRDDIPENYRELEVQYIKNEIVRPEWMVAGESSSGYSYNTSLHLIPKDEKYSLLANKILAFLNSQDHESCYDG